MRPRPTEAESAPPAVAAPRRLAAAALLAVAAIAALAAGAAWVCPGAACGVTPFDRAGLAAFDGLRSPALDAVFAALTWLGSLWLLLPAALAVAWRAWAASAAGAPGSAADRRRRAVDAAFVPVALLAVAALARVAKAWVERPRPDLYEPLVALPGDASYPSAHTMQACAFALAWLLRPGARPRGAEIAVAALLAAAVALSRPYLQVHFPSDVVAGAAAAACAVLALRCLPLWPARSRPTDRRSADPGA